MTDMLYKKSCAIKMFKQKNRQFDKSNRKQLGQILMILGLLGIGFSIIEPLIAHIGCFGYSFYSVLLDILPIAMLIIGYRVYSLNE